MLTFLGIKLDSLFWKAELPKELLLRNHSMVQKWSGRKSCKVQLITSIGKRSVKHVVLHIIIFFGGYEMHLLLGMIYR